MTFFKEIENRLENLFEDFFSKKWRSAIQPLELARKLAAEMDAKKQISVSLVYAPNVFKIDLAKDDFLELEGIHQSLAVELSNYLRAYAKDKNYRLTGSIHIIMLENISLIPGRVKISSHLEEEISHAETAGDTQVIPAGQVQEILRASEAVLESSQGHCYQIKTSVTTIGRRRDNDIEIKDPSVSRYHAQIESKQGSYQLVDLNSTNGTLVNGDEIKQITLTDSDHITFGAADFIFKIKDV